MGCKNSVSSASTTGEDFESDWCLVEKLGEGSFSQVHAVIHKTSSRTAALKISKGADLSSRVKKEAIVWRKVGTHVNIVEFMDDFALVKSHAILMEKCDHALAKYLADMHLGNEPAVTRMIYQMTSAIAHFHSLNIVHRDIKPDNFLCIGDAPLLKLCDFGFAFPMPKSGRLFGTCGTPHYMSPEMLGIGPHNLKTDVWSLGVICYLLFYGNHPYSSRSRDNESVMRAISKGTPEPTYQGRCDVSCAAKETTMALMHRYMPARLSAAQALELPFLNSASDQVQLDASLKSNGPIIDFFSESQSTRVSCNCDGSDATGSISEPSKSITLQRIVSL